MGECFFWYRPTRVVPDQRPLKGRRSLVPVTTQSSAQELNNWFFVAAEILFQCCTSGKVIVDDKGIKDSWKGYMEKLMHEENEWDHKISAEVKERPADCIRISSHHLIFYSLKTVVKRNCVQSSYTYAYNKMLW